MVLATDATELLFVLNSGLIALSSPDWSLPDPNLPCSRACRAFQTYYITHFITHMTSCQTIVFGVWQILQKNPAFCRDSCSDNLAPFSFFVNSWDVPNFYISYQAPAAHHPSPLIFYKYAPDECFEFIFLVLLTHDSYIFSSRKRALGSCQNDRIECEIPERSFECITCRTDLWGHRGVHCTTPSYHIHCARCHLARPCVMVISAAGLVLVLSPGTMLISYDFW